MKKIIYHPQIETFHIDFMQHVSNIVYIQWMEVGRGELLKAVGLAAHDIVKEGFGPVLVETHISYKHPLFLGDQVTAELHISDLSRVSAWLDFRFENQDGKLIAEGRQRGLFVDLASGRPKRLPPAWLERFQEFAIDADDA